ncbi:MAG: hypothetical protein MZV64_10275 [Ignavibacteriales bacterium]|nr:hypothetical protein [Ignavibacteriales bacterium]
MGKRAVCSGGLLPGFEPFVLPTGNDEIPAPTHRDPGAPAAWPRGLPSAGRHGRRSGAPQP